MSQAKLDQFRHNNYALCVLTMDIVEQRVRCGELLAPAWYVQAWRIANHVIEKARTGSA